MLDRKPALRAAGSAAAAACLACLLATLLAGCLFETSRTAGGGSDIGNGGAIAGVVLGGDGLPASGVTVRIRPRDYLPAAAPAPKSAGRLDTLGEVRTGADGAYRFAAMDTGEYRLEILDSARGAGALVDCRLGRGVRALDLPEARLSPTGSLRVRLPALGESDFQVRFYGLERVARLDTGAHLEIRGLAPGAYAFRTRSRNPLLDNLEARAVMVAGDSVTEVADLVLPCDSRACDSTVLAGFLAANGLPGDLAAVSNASGRSTDLFFRWSDTSLRITTLGDLRRLDKVKAVHLEGPFLPDSLGARFFAALAHMDSLWMLRIEKAGEGGLRSLPAGVGRLASLTQLYVNDDSLETIPDEIGNLRKLEMLFLRGNRLASLPASMTGLQALAQLHVPSNRLTALPAGILQLPKLVKMDVFGNRLCALSDAEKARLQALGSGPEGQTCP